MKKRLSVILASVLAAAELVPCGANAVFQLTEDTGGYFEKIGAVPLDEKYYPVYERNISYYEKLLKQDLKGIYVLENDFDSSFYTVYPHYSDICFFTTDAAFSAAQLNEKLAEHFGDKVRYNGVIYRNGISGERLYTLSGTDDSILREIRDLLAEELNITSMTAHWNMEQIVEIHHGFTDKGISYFSDPSLNDIESIIEFADANGLDHVCEGTYTYIVPPENTLKSKLDTALAIYDATGMAVVGETPTTMQKNETAGVDVLNSIAGDVNCDGEVTIADAAAILQSLGSRELYRLSPQGEFNADVSGGYDGITIKDALEIQKYKAGLVESLR